MNARPSWVSAAALTLLLIPASAALSQPGSPDKTPTPGEAGTRRGGPGLHQRMHERGGFAGLGLSDAQRTKLKSLREQGEAGRVTLRKQVLRLQNEMRGAMLADQPDRRKIVQLAEQIGTLRTRLAVQRVEQRLAMREVLTPEQRDRWLAREPRRGMRGHGGVRGHGGRTMQHDGPPPRGGGGDEI